VLDVYEAVVAFLTGLGDEVQVRELKNYIAFKRIKNFCLCRSIPAGESRELPI
jgi:predicted transport protein